MDFDFKRNNIRRKLSIYDTHAELEVISSISKVIYLNKDFVTTINRNKLKHVFIKSGRIQIKTNDSIEELKYAVVKHYTGYPNDEIVHIKFIDSNIFNCRFENLTFKVKEPITSVIFEDTANCKLVDIIEKKSGWSKRVFHKKDYAILEFFKNTLNGMVVIQSLFDQTVLSELCLDSITLDYRKSQLERNRWRIKYLKQKIHRYILDAPKYLEVDHIDRNPLNNRSSNIRLCDHRTNVLNQDVNIRSNTGLKGIQFYHHSKTKKRYIRISISNNGSTVYKFIDPLNYDNDIEALEYAQTIRMSLENEFNYNGICSHEGSETIESDHRSSRD